MKMILYSIKDKAAGTFGPVVEAVNDVVANRAYTQMIDKVPIRYKADYVLHRIGIFDTETGEVTPYQIIVDCPMENQEVK